MRNRLTAAGLGLAINKSLRAGTRRVSEKVDFTMHCIRARVVSLPPPKRICGILAVMSRAVHAQSAPWDLRWEVVVEDVHERIDRREHNVEEPKQFFAHVSWGQF